MYVVLLESHAAAGAKGYIAFRRKKSKLIIEPIIFYDLNGTVLAS
jgi:hypothetical protein